MSETQVTERTSLASRVRAGVALLDEKEPGWHHRVDPETLDINIPCCCVIGQLFGSYSAGLCELDLYYGIGAHGFNGIVDTDDQKASDREYDALTRLWAYVIRQRQAVSQ